jgi:hypothetical protein
MRSLPPWLSKLAAVTLVAGLTALVALYGVLPIVEQYSSLQGDLVHSQEMITGLSKTGERRDILVKRIELLESSLMGSGVLLQSVSESLATAELRETVKRIIERTGGELQSSQNLSVVDKSGFKRVAIRIAFRGTIEELKPLLYELEAHRPYLFVNTLEIKTGRSRRPAQASEAAAQAPSLLARLDLYGYILSEAGS